MSYVHCTTLQQNTLQHGPLHVSTQGTASFHKLQHAATRCNTGHCEFPQTATRCNTLQHRALRVVTNCNTLQHAATQGTASFHHRFRRVLYSVISFFSRFPSKKDYPAIVTQLYVKRPYKTSIMRHFGPSNETFLPHLN